MIKKENLCVDCTVLGMHCRGRACPYHKPVEVECCDKCEEILDKVYDVDGEVLCEECLKEKFLRP